MAHLGPLVLITLCSLLLRPAAAAAAAAGADCPAPLIARFLADEVAWPPATIGEQGLTCTLELSQLSVALPGTNTACSVLRISNKLQSILHSWQLVWQQRDGSLAAVAAPAGATLVGGGPADDSGGDRPRARAVQLINRLDSPSIAAQSGFADVLVQLGVANTSSSSGADALDDGGDAAPANSTRGSSKPRKGARTTTTTTIVSPAMDAVFLNGLQCTRLPLAKPPPGASGLPEDCGIAAWTLDADSRAFAMPAGLDLGNLTESSNASFFALLWGALGNSSSSSSNSNSSLGGSNATPRLQGTSVEAALQVLRQAACMSRLCCGLQVVVDEGTDQGPTTNSSRARAANDSNTPPPMVGAFEGPDPRTKVSLNGSKPGPGTAGEALPLDITPTPAVPTGVGSGSSSSVAGLVAGLVVGGVSAACLGGLLVLLLRRQRRLSNALKRQASGDAPLSRHGSGADSLASVASQEWQQHQQQAARQHTILQAVGKPPVPGWPPRPPDYVLPTHNTAPAHMLQSAAADATSGPAGGTVWRASSWQGPDAGTLEPQLLRSSSSPQSLPPPLLPPGGLASPPTPAPQPAAGPSRQHSATQEPLAAAVASAGSPDAGDGDSPGMQPPGTMLSTWGSLQRLFSGGSSNGKAAGPWSSTRWSPASSSMAADAAGASVSTLAARTARLQGVTALPHQPLQLIQESAPLASTSGPLSQQQQRASSPFDLAAAALGGGGSRLVSRRVSPIVSVLEDGGSSATSTDSLAPAAWHLTDRQLLEEQPGWLQIDFASELRLEKKLGEGGFGQVFRARWRGEVIAAKLVPFMSLVAHQHSPVPLSLMSAAVGSSTGDAAAADAAAGRHPGNPSVEAAAPPPHMNLGVGVQFSAASLRAIKVEIRVLSQLAHPNIVAFKGACLAPPHICILEELAEGGSLHSRLYSRSNARRAQQLQQAGSSSRPSRPRQSGGGGSSRASLPPPLTISEVLHIAIDVARAVAYLHALQPQVVHRDLKPSNVLLDLQGRAKVCDFGISKMKQETTAASSTRLGAGTPQYMAVEQFEGCPVTDKVDVFAFAVLLWECLEQQPPWKELSAMQIIYAVGLQKERLPRPARCPAGMWRLISACWAQDPHDRPSFVEVLRTLEELQAEAGAEQLAVSEAVASPARPATAKQLPHSQPPAAAAQAEESSSADADDVDARVAVVC